MSTKEEASTPDLTERPQALRMTSRPQQMSLSLFPAAPGRPLAAVAAHTGAVPRLRQSERAGDSQIRLPIRGNLLD